jgi:hypothetical protein
VSGSCEHVNIPIMLYAKFPTEAPPPHPHTHLRACRGAWWKLFATLNVVALAIDWRICRNNR